MASAGVVHVITGHRSGLWCAIRDSLAGDGQVLAWQITPPTCAVKAGDLVVADLDDLPAGARVGSLWRLVDRAGVLLVSGEQPVHPDWLALAKHARVTVVPCGAAARVRVCAPAVAAIQAELREPTPDEVTRLVVEAEPSLDGLGRYVRALCDRPWQVRRPRDLAVAVSESIGRLRRECRSVGFTRVEHFVIAVRAIAYQELVSRLKLSVGRARLLAGFDNPSNVRRDLRRATIRSPLASPLHRALEPVLANHQRFGAATGF